MRLPLSLSPTTLLKSSSIILTGFLSIPWSGVGIHLKGWRVMILFPCLRPSARTSVERAYSEEKGSHRLANPRVRKLSRVKTHVYLALCAQVIKRIGATIIERLIKPYPILCPVKTWRTLKQITRFWS